MAIEIINIPDIGGAEGVDVIEVSVAVGDTITADQEVLMLESDKASMDIPSPKGGVVKAILVKEGDKVVEGTPMLELEVEGDAAAPEAEPVAAPVQAAAPVSTESAPASSVSDIAVPDIGGAEGVEVIEVYVAVGDTVNEGDSLIVLESDKASMEIPAPASGKITAFTIKVGDKASQGDVIGQMEIVGAAPVAAPAPEAPKAAAPANPAPVKAPESAPVASAGAEIVVSSSEVYAGPAVRKLARELGVNLAEVKGTGTRGRVSFDDVHAFVKAVMKTRASGGGSIASGSGIPAVPEVDYAKFGEIELVKMSKIKQLTAEAMTRNWLNIPRVTQFDDADITDVEAFRKGMKAEAEKSGVKLTPMPFIIKAAAAALQMHPSFNVAMHNDGEHIIQKKFIHIAIAVDTPRGLMVPVIKDVDQKGIYQIAKELIELAGKARDGKLKPAEMQGGCFTISSLGPMGGTGFTPMVSTTEAGILGVSKASMQPVWDGAAFQPRMMLPLSLSYDHRAVNGSDAGKFLTYLSAVMGDVRRLLL